MFDLNTQYSRYDALGTGSGTTISYYGYTIQGVNGISNPSDTSVVFSLKKTYYIDNVQYIEWANGYSAGYECSWTNRSSYFATPSNIAVTATSSFDGSRTNITFNWNASTGSSRYNALITYNGGNTVRYLADACSSAVLNPENKPGNFIFINQTSCVAQNCLTGYTYSISIYPYNSAGAGSVSTVSIKI